METLSFSRVLRPLCHVPMLGLLTLATWGTAADMVVINAASGINQLTDDQLKDVFLGKRTTWEDGSKVIVVVVKTGPSATALLARLGKNSQQFQTGWKKLVFTGKGSMPETAATDDAAVDFVSKTPGAITLVDATRIKDGVKSVTIR